MVKRIDPIKIKTNQLCEYGCGQKAKFIVTINGKKCCSKTWESCPRLKQKKNGKGIKKNYSTNKIKSNKLCYYGCGNIAKYLLKNGKLCCHNKSNSCPELIRKSSQSRTGAKRTKEMKKKISESHIGQISNKKGKNFLEIYGEEKAKTIIRKMQNSNKRTIQSFKENHSFFYQIEELREDPKSKEIQVRCKNHNCPNSKDLNGWFIPTYTQIDERIRQLESENGNGGSYFYCSEYCKNTCDLYGKTAEQIMRQDLINAGHIKEEILSIPGYEIWRDEVYKRNKKTFGFTQCEICGKTEKLIAHHIYPKKSHPNMVLDPNNGLIVCQKCHFEKCHPKGTKCSFGELAKLVCEKRYRLKSLNN